MRTYCYLVNKKIPCISHISCLLHIPCFCKAPIYRFHLHILHPQSTSLKPNHISVAPILQLHGSGVTGTTLEIHALIFINVSMQSWFSFLILCVCHWLCFFYQFKHMAMFFYQFKHMTSIHCKSG